MVEATITKIESGEHTKFKLVQTEEVVISASTEDELFELFFRQYDNGLKYVNSISYKFKDEEMAAKYRAWTSDVNNYVKAGGDMW